MVTKLPVNPTDKDIAVAAVTSGRWKRQGAIREKLR